ncbi:MAG: ABC transporter permease [Magnetococcales bacterium]|nr:ABC transporter permease [Magnetococcales bacterium]
MTNLPSSTSAIATIAVFTLREALRERLIRATMLMVGLGWVFSLFLDELLLTGNESSRAAILAFFFRLGSIFQITILVTFAVARDLHNRGLDSILALPFPRGVSFVGKGLGFALTALLLAGVCGIALLPLAPWNQVLLWSLVLACELLLMASLSLLLTLAIQQAPLALTMTAGFYLLSRSMSTVLLIAQQTKEMVPHWSTTGAKFVLTVIASALPDLNHFTTTEWLVYHTGSLDSLWPILGETTIYLMLLTAMGLFDLYRKEF